MRHGLRGAARWFVAATVVFTTTVLWISPVRASMSGGGQFQATVTVAPDPCAAQCPLNINGWFRGSFSGIEVGGAVYTAVFPNPAGGAAAVLAGNFADSALVTDNCTLGDGLPAVTETSLGSVTVSGGALVDSAGNVLEQGISLTAGWHWTGAVVGSLVVDVIGTSGSSLADAQGHVIATGIVGAGAALFIPTPPISVGTCAAPGTSMGVFVGAVGQPA